MAFGGDGGSTPEKIGIRASVGTASVRIFQGPFVSRGPEAIGGGGSSSGSLSQAGIITQDADIYVHYNGDDTTGDGSIGNPYKSVQRAVSQYNFKTISGAQIIIRVEPDTSPTEDAYLGWRRDWVPFWANQNGYYTMSYCDVGLRDITVTNNGMLYIGYGLTQPSYGQGPGWGILGMMRCKAPNGNIYVGGLRGLWGYVQECENINLENCSFGMDLATPHSYPRLRVSDTKDLDIRACWFYGGDPGIEAREQSSVRCRYTFCHSNVRGVGSYNGSSIYLAGSCRSGYWSPYDILSITKVGSQVDILLDRDLHRFDQEMNHVFISGASQSQNNGFYAVPSSPRARGIYNVIRANNSNGVNQASPAGLAELSNKGPALYMAYAGSTYIISSNRWTFRGTTNTQTSSGLWEAGP